MVKLSAKTGFSRYIDLGRFKRESWRLLAYGFLFAVAFHAVLSILVMHRTPKVRVTLRKEPHRVIRTDIIELPPRFTAPITVAKPRFTPRAVRPEGMVRSGPVLPATSGLLFKSPPDPLMERWDAFSPEMPRMPDEKGVADSAFQYLGGMEPGNIVGRKIPRESHLDGELLQPEDFVNTKEWWVNGLLEYNPREKLAIRGIVPICELWGSIGSVKLTPNVIRFVNGIRNYTDLVPGRWERHFLGADTYMGYPFVYVIPCSRFEWLPTEADMFGDYLRHGGFALFIGGKEFIMDALGPQTRFIPVPIDDPVFHCYFDFSDGSFLGSDVEKYLIVTKGPIFSGIWIGNRLAVLIYSDVIKLSDDTVDRLNINCLIYALRQDGGNAVVLHNRSLKPGIQAKRNIAGQTLIPMKQ